MKAPPQKIVNRADNQTQRTAPPTLQRASAAPTPQPVGSTTTPGHGQRGGVLKISSPTDPAEREAEAVARRVVQMTTPQASPSDASGPPAPQLRSPHGARLAAAIVQRKPLIARHGEGQPADAGDIAAEISASRASGTPLPPSVRRFMEPRFGASFDRVRIHTDERAARLNRQVSARAFTVGHQIFFGRGAFDPDSSDGRELIAHELTHTIQQGAVAQSSTEVVVSERSEPQLQRLGISDALDYFADKAYHIPGFRLFTIVLGVNPVNMSRVERTPANIMRAIVEFLPGGHLITQALDNHGVFDRVGAWVAQQIASLGMIGSAIKRGIDQFLDSLSWRDIFRLGGVWRRAKRIFTEPIDRLIGFVKGLASGILKLIKDAILLPIARLAQGTRGYPLLCAVLGEDPVTNEPVQPTPEALIGGFMKLIRQEEVWANMRRANAVPRAFAWFKGAVAALVAMVRQVPTRFLNAFRSLTIGDIVVVPRAFAKLVGVFGNFVGSFASWAGNAVWNLLEIVFDVVSPGAFRYIKRTGAALRSILKNPLPFVGNLVRAAKQGFLGFSARFGKHVKDGLIDWLTGSLPGIYIPKAFALGEIVKFVFSALGLTWQAVRVKLVKVVGEPVVKAMETGFDIVVTLVTQGPAAAWEKIQDHLAALKETVIGGITDLVVDSVVKKAIPKLVAMFIPGAGFISAILSIYDTIMVFVSKISRIIQVVTSFLNSLVAIAVGNVAAAAKRVETTLAGLLTLAINFLAGFAGLGKISDKIMGIIHRVRAPIDKALDALVNWIVTMAKSGFAKAKSAASRLFDWAVTRSSFRDEEGHSHTVYVDADGGTPRLMIASNPMAAEQFLDWYVNKKGEEFRKHNETKIGAVRTAIKEADKAANTVAIAKDAGKDEATLQPLLQILLTRNVAVSSALARLIDSDATIGKLREKYLLEGLTGTYASMPKPKGDGFTADHQPQAAILEAAAEFEYFSENGELAKRAAGRAKQGFAINLHHIRHQAGSTYGSKGKATKEGFLARIKPLVHRKKREEQRGVVIAEIKADLLRDVNAMKGVATEGSAHWEDIRKREGISKKEQDKLIKEIKDRIHAGEDQMAAQDIESLTR